MFCALLIVMALAAGDPAAESAPPLLEGFILVAHRGVTDDGARENTLAALEAAIARGYTHVEVDVQATLDGIPVCLHDRGLKRTAGAEGNVDQLTYAQFRERVSEELAPSFEAYCAAAAGRIALMPDIKASLAADALDTFAAHVEESLTKHGLLAGALFIGRADVAARFLGKARLARRGDLEGLRRARREQPIDPAQFFIFDHAKAFDERTVKGFQELGFQVIVSINTFHYPGADPLQRGREDVARMLALGVDGLQIDSVYDRFLPGR